MAERPDILHLLEKVRRIHLRSRKAVDEFMAGQFRSAFKGTGIEFHEVRDYQPGDDIRIIDWNVTARSGAPHVKTFVEERELSVFLLVDASASTAFGSGSAIKSETIAEFCALVGLSAASSSDRVGLVLFSDGIERHVPLGKGLQHILRILREVLAPRPEGRGTRIRAALDYLARVRRRRAIVFLISDFLDHGYERSLRLAARRHDLIAVRVADPREHALEGRGVLRLRDLETGEERQVDLAAPALRERYALAAVERTRALERTFASLSVDFLDLETGASMAGRLRAFFQKRLRRRAGA